MESGFIDKEVGFKEREDDPDIGWIDGKDNGDETWDHDGGYKARKNRSVSFQEEKTGCVVVKDLSIIY